MGGTPFERDFAFWDSMGTDDSDMVDGGTPPPTCRVFALRYMEKTPTEPEKTGRVTASEI